MHFNIAKCSIIIFSRQNSEIVCPYYINGIIIERVTVVKVLEVFFDSKLSHRIHISNVIGKALQMAGFIMSQRWKDGGTKDN